MYSAETAVPSDDGEDSQRYHDPTFGARELLDILCPIRKA